MKRILVIGDVIIDRYTHGTKRGLSAETPTIVANLGKEEMFVGGAGLVARNLVRLGNEVDLVTVIPERDEVFDVNFLREHVKESSDPLTASEMKQFRTFGFRVSGWKVPEKRRYYVDDYKLLQYDDLNQKPWTVAGEEGFLRQITAHVTAPRKVRKKGCDYADYSAIVVCDNRHGVITERVARGLVKLAKKEKVPIYVDSQVSQSASNHSWYKGANFIFMNEVEANAVGKSLLKLWYAPGEADLGEIARKLDTNVILKRGAAGSAHVTIQKTAYLSQGFKVDAVDTCGAGDAFLAAFVSSGNSMRFANRWAALSTTYKGTIVPELRRLEEMPE